MQEFDEKPPTPPIWTGGVAEKRRRNPQIKISLRPEDAAYWRPRLDELRLIMAMARRSVVPEQIPAFTAALEANLRLVEAGDLNYTSAVAYKTIRAILDA